MWGISSRASCLPFVCPQRYKIFWWFKLSPFYSDSSAVVWYASLPVLGACVSTPSCPLEDKHYCAWKSGRNATNCNYRNFPTNAQYTYVCGCTGTQGKKTKQDVIGVRGNEGATFKSPLKWLRRRLSWQRACLANARTWVQFSEPRYKAR